MHDASDADRAESLDRARELDAPEPAQDLLARGAAFHWGQRGAQAEVLAIAEGDVPAGVSRRAELLRVGAEHVLVAVRRGVEHEHAVALPEAHTAQLRVARGRAHEAADRSAPTEHLLDGT